MSKGRVISNKQAKKLKSNEKLIAKALENAEQQRQEDAVRRLAELELLKKTPKYLEVQAAVNAERARRETEKLALITSERTRQLVDDLAARLQVISIVDNVAASSTVNQQHATLPDLSEHKDAEAGLIATSLANTAPITLDVLPDLSAHHDVNLSVDALVISEQLDDDSPVLVEHPPLVSDAVSVSQPLLAASLDPVVVNNVQTVAHNDLVEDDQYEHVESNANPATVQPVQGGSWAGTALSYVSPFSWVNYLRGNGASAPGSAKDSERSL